MKARRRVKKKASTKRRTRARRPRKTVKRKSPKKMAKKKVKRKKAKKKAAKKKVAKKRIGARTKKQSATGSTRISTHVMGTARSTAALLQSAGTIPSTGTVYFMTPEGPRQRRLHRTRSVRARRIAKDLGISDKTRSDARKLISRLERKGALSWRSK